MNARRFPRTWAALAAAPDGERAFAHLGELEAGFGRRQPIETASVGGPAANSSTDVDVAIAGGGLSLLYAAALARAGWRVAVFDRRRIGSGHREWNVSWGELAPLVESGLFSEADRDRLVAMRYREGLIQWHGGERHRVRDVLDCVVDAEWLLATLRERAEADGARLLDGHALAGYRVGPGGVEVRLSGPEGELAITARLLIDAMGAASPHARHDLVCPTVGGVFEGLEDVDPHLGEILVSTEGVEDGKQHIWEGFPGPNGRMTVYLFHYAEPSGLGEHPLYALYERFFETLPRYKGGTAHMLKPTYGFIPAYTRLRPGGVAPADRVVLVGDAAGRHSPLTFCGFGSMIRSFLPVSEGLSAALTADRLDRRALAGVWREPACLGVMGALALMMVGGRMRPGESPEAINALLEAAFAAIAEAGEPAFQAFLRDEIGFKDFTRWLSAIAPRHPRVFAEVGRRLSAPELLVWSRHAARFAFKQWGSARS